jgi:hypothetical protein
MTKKKWCHYITLEVIFSHGEVNGSFSKLLTRANNYRKFLYYFFLANKPLGIVHAEMCRKLLILCAESSKFWTKNAIFGTGNL